MKKTYRLAHDTARKLAIECVAQAPDGYIVTVAEPTRTLDQNAAQWPYLAGFAQQRQWPVNGKLEWLSEDDWKDILTCAFKNEQVRIAQGIDGGMVLLGRRTSKFKVSEFSDWMEFLKATAAERGVTPVYVGGERDGLDSNA